MNGLRKHDALDFSDDEGEGVHDDHAGDYSARLEEVMSGMEDDSNGHAHEEAEQEEEEFVYSGMDASTTGGYREQLRDVLGPDHEEDELDEREVELSLLHDVQEKEHLASLMEDEARPVGTLSDTPSTPPTPPTTVSGATSPPKLLTLNGRGTPDKFSRPFLHPTISRLRSTTPQASRAPSSASLGTVYSHARGMASESPSHISALSRTSSVMNLIDDAAGEANDPAGEREVFRWTQLRVIGDTLFVKHPQKASSVLGTEDIGLPTVMAANGLICVGTDVGRVAVFDFKQNLKCVCGTDDKTVGPVTAVTLSFDHTFVATGHATGHVQLFEISNPKVPARFVAPTSLTEVASGRQEGHLVGSRIVSVGFVAGRHTAIVSADDSGLSFYHSLGKILFMDASDTLRLLGRYSEDNLGVGPSSQGTTNHFRRRKSRKGTSLLSMAPLPLGTASHSTDQYNLIALLTPVKLVIVGLKPSPRTWYRRHREDDDVDSRSKFKGTLAWYPSVVPGGGPVAELTSKKDRAHGSNHNSSTVPMLVYSWGDTISLIGVSETKVSQQTRNLKTGVVSTVKVGRVTFEEAGQWTASGDILALQWLNAHQVIVLTADALEVYDVRSRKLVEQARFDARTLVSPTLSHTINSNVSYPDAIMEVSHSLRVYKGKIFVLGQHELQAGTLLTWADRILSFVREGNFLSAIELTRAYYLGESPGNRNGLPDSPEKMKHIVGEKMYELMAASARYAFSEERLTDGTHASLDGRGVDRTSLFEDLVRTCTQSCMALGDYDFLYEELFQYYDDHGISRIFLSQLEPFVIDGNICHVPPRISQRLIAMHEEDGRSDRAERVIWHTDPDCLDVNQAITLCQRHWLYDALVYVFTRAMRDYVSPLVELLGLVRQVQQYRRTREEGLTIGPHPNDNSIEPVVMNAYKIFPYLGNILTGLTYPSADPLPRDEAEYAKQKVYLFLSSGQSQVFPPGDSGKLVLTAEEENGTEPTYPYARLLLRFDPEAFLHTLDLAFEDSYFNVDAPGVSRLLIIKILLDIKSSGDLQHDAVTFVNIFVARNVPKYYLADKMPDTALHNTLIGLAEDSDQSTQEDRQLAAEYLLSAYTPHELSRITALFEKAGFYRILRTWYGKDRKWTSLLLTYVNDRNLTGPEVFNSLDEVLVSAKRVHKGILPPALLTTLTASLPSLLGRSVTRTAALLDAHYPALHDKAVGHLQGRSDEDQFTYLRSLLGPNEEATDDDIVASRKGGPSSHVPAILRRTYLSLQCRFNPSGVILALRALPHNFLSAEDTSQICKEHAVFDAVIWVLDRQGTPLDALAKADNFGGQLSSKLADALVRTDADSETVVQETLTSLGAVAQRAATTCLERSETSDDVPLEDIWYQLLRSQINVVQRVAGCCMTESPDPAGLDSARSRQFELQQRTLSVLRASMQSAFTALMTISSSKGISLPRLFKRLLTTASNNATSKPTLYAEVRALFTGMLETYRSDGDMLIITKHLVDRDLFTTIEELTRERVRGWTPSQGRCQTCKEWLVVTSTSEQDPRTGGRITALRTGALYHQTCLPSTQPTK